MERYIELLKSKLYRGRVTAASLEYEGSLGISRELCEAVGLLEFEKILVANLANGERWETYVIMLDGPGQIVLNGAAARKGMVGDSLIVMSFVGLEQNAAQEHQPQVVHLDADNRIMRNGGK